MGVDFVTVFKARKSEIVSDDVVTVFKAKKSEIVGHDVVVAVFKAKNS